MYYYSVYDKKAETYSTLSPGVNKEVYLRGLTSALLGNPSSMFVSYPEDYEIYQILDFDDGDGCVYDSEPEFICSMTEVVKRMKHVLGRSEEDGSDEAVQK